MYNNIVRLRQTKIRKKEEFIMLVFLIFVAVTFLFVGIPIIIGGIGRHKKIIIKRIIVAIITSVTLGGLLFVCIYREYQIDSKIWNNGMHETCGKWEILDIERSRSGSTHYYYKCNKCGKTVDLATNFTE